MQWVKKTTRPAVQNSLVEDPIPSFTQTPVMDLLHPDLTASSFVDSPGYTKHILAILTKTPYPTLEHGLPQYQLAVCKYCGFADPANPQYQKALTRPPNLETGPIFGGVIMFDSDGNIQIRRYTTPHQRPFEDEVRDRIAACAHKLGIQAEPDILFRQMYINILMSTTKIGTHFAMRSSILGEAHTHTDRSQHWRVVGCLMEMRPKSYLNFTDPPMVLFEYMHVIQVVYYHDYNTGAAVYGNTFGAKWIPLPTEHRIITYAPTWYTHRYNNPAVQTCHGQHSHLPGAILTLGRPAREHTNAVMTLRGVPSETRSFEVSYVECLCAQNNQDLEVLTTVREYCEAMHRAAHGVSHAQTLERLHYRMNQINMTIYNTRTPAFTLGTRTCPCRNDPNAHVTLHEIGDPFGPTFRIPTRAFYEPTEIYIDGDTWWTIGTHRGLLAHAQTIKPKFWVSKLKLPPHMRVSSSYIDLELPAPGFNVQVLGQNFTIGDNVVARMKIGTTTNTGIQILLFWTNPIRLEYGDVTCHLSIFAINDKKTGTLTFEPTIHAAINSDELIIDGSTSGPSIERQQLVPTNVNIGLTTAILMYIHNHGSALLHEIGRKQYNVFPHDRISPPVADQDYSVTQYAAAYFTNMWKLDYTQPLEILVNNQSFCIHPPEAPGITGCHFHNITITPTYGTNTQFAAVRSPFLVSTKLQTIHKSYFKGERALSEPIRTQIKEDIERFTHRFREQDGVDIESIDYTYCTSCAKSRPSSLFTKSSSVCSTCIPGYICPLCTVACSRDSNPLELIMHMDSQRCKARHGRPTVNLALLKDFPHLTQYFVYVYTTHCPELQVTGY